MSSKPHRTKTNSRQNNIFPSCLLITLFTACIGVINGKAQTTDSWNLYSLSIHAGNVLMPARLEDKGPYNGKSFSGEMETGISFATKLTDSAMLDMLLSNYKAAGTLNSSTPEAGANFLDENIEVTIFWLSWKYYPGFHQTQMRPWYAMGVHAGILEEGYRERFPLGPSVYYSEGLTKKTSAVAGFHVNAGIDIYPSRNSSFCISLSLRGNASATSGDFDGNISSPAVLAALRWDFGVSP